jgi:2-octaprenyl-6-methoxyphenol hydroxylase
VLERQVDVLIVGGGLIGSMLLLILADCGYNALLIEKKTSLLGEADFDARSLALAPASVQILKTLKLWSYVQAQACAIEQIHVSEQYRFGHARLQAQDEPLGYVLEINTLQRLVQEKLPKAACLAPAELLALDSEQGIALLQTAQGEMKVQAHLIVAADGADSAVRHYCDLRAHINSYEQTALVANIGLARAHDQQAFERFTAAGPFALLPLQGLRMALVWAQKPEQAQAHFELDDAAFLKVLQLQFGYRLGRFVKVGKRQLYPLRQVIMSQQTKGRVVFIGNAAHSLHPVAGQGFNLGLRDVASLVQCLLHDGFTPPMLHHYRAMREHDHDAITQSTHALVKLFTSPWPGLAPLRGLGLVALDNLSGLKRLLLHYAQGYAAITPDLVCGIPLEKMHESMF